MDLAFLDANVLFSAAYRRDSPLRQLWVLKGIELLSSALALEEARRNLADFAPVRVGELEALAKGVNLLPEPPDVVLKAVERLGLDESDRAVFLAAALGGATHFLTGDKRHFGGLFGRKLMGVTVLAPADFLRPKGSARRGR